MDARVIQFTFKESDTAVLTSDGLTVEAINAADVPCVVHIAGLTPVALAEVLRPYAEETKSAEKPKRSPARRAATAKVAAAK